MHTSNEIFVPKAFTGEEPISITRAAGEKEDDKKKKKVARATSRKKMTMKERKRIPANLPRASCFRIIPNLSMMENRAIFSAERLFL